MDLGITDQTTQSGRPIAELNADKEVIAKAQRAGIRFAATTCDYADSRKGRPMNTDALSDVASRWQEVLDGLVWIHVNYFRSSLSISATASAAVVLCSIGLAMPAYCFARRENRSQPYADLPDIVGDIYKTTNGMHAAAIEIAMRRGLNCPTTPGDFYTFSDQKGLFFSQDKRVCPAPKPMIRSAAEALLFGRCGRANLSELDGFIPDFRKLKEFTIQFFNFRTDVIGPCL